MSSVRVRRGSVYSDGGPPLVGANRGSVRRTVVGLPAREQIEAEGRRSQDDALRPPLPDFAQPSSRETSPAGVRRPFSRVMESLSRSARASQALRSQRSFQSGQSNVPSQASGLAPPLSDRVASEELAQAEEDEDEEEEYSDDEEESDDDHHGHEVIEHLNAIDARVATVGHLANAANSILIPPIPIYSRRPVISFPGASAPLMGEKGDELDRHVESILAKRSNIRRTLQGVWAFIKTPIGVISAVYGFLCAFWGAAIVIFLAKIINLHNPITQGFWVEVSSQIENALFTVTGIGLIPWRVLDTYRIYRIWYYKRLTRKLRKKEGLPVLYDEDDLPDPLYDPNYVHVLSDKQQLDLHHQQKEFMKSQTWYRPHGTETHRAFPITNALWICLFIDGNSVFQCMLCGTMWGLDRFQRPAWSTGILIPASFLCAIVSAVLIWKGGQKTKRTKEVEDRLRTILAMEDRPGSVDLFKATGCAPGPSVQVDDSRPATWVEEKMVIPKKIPTK